MEFLVHAYCPDYCSADSHYHHKADVQAKPADCEASEGSHISFQRWKIGGCLLDNHGQEEAPFELLIAVIVMGFVIFLGLQAMNYVTQEQCKAQIKYSASQLKAVIQDVVAGNTKNLVFDPPQCFEKPKDREEMRFVVIKDTLQCSQLCGSTKNECFVFLYNSKEYNYALCFENVSPQTTFYTSAPVCEELERFQPTDLKDSISRGAFEFVNKSSSIEAFPKICAYLRTGG